MTNIMKLSIGAIKVHPRNTEFFDDIGGKEYEAFLNSIKEEGILTPLIVSNDMTLLSGHQRLKAAQDAGITSLPVIIREDVSSEEDKLAILLAANFGRQKNDDAKQRKVAVEYVKLRGNKRGTNQHSRNCDNRSSTLTQDQIASELGVSVRTLNEILDIERKLTPEVKELLDNGAFTKTTASKILVRLTKEEQVELLTTFGADIIKGATQYDMKQYVQRIKDLELENAKLENDVDIAEEKYEDLKANMFEDDDDDIGSAEEIENKIRFEYERAEKYKKEAANKDREIKELRAKVADAPKYIEVEIPPDDYEDLRERLRLAEDEVERQKFLNKNSVQNNNIEKVIGLDLFKRSCEEYYSGISTYQFAEEIFAQTCKEELREYLALIADIEETIITIRGKVEEAL